jgi:hypothetical protein
MEITTPKVLERIDENLSRLEKLESESKDAEMQLAKDIHKAEMRADVYRSNYAYFSQLTQGSHNPGLQRVCTLEAEHFGEMARHEDEHVARLRDYHDRRAELEQRRAELFAKLLALREEALDVKQIQTN